jgi:hypothetical protein
MCDHERIRQEDRERCIALVLQYFRSWVPDAVEWYRDQLIDAIRQGDHADEQFTHAQPKP